MASESKGEGDMPDTRASTKARPKAKAIDVNERYCSGCGICIEFCPFDVLAASKDMSERGVYPAAVVDLEKCTVCRLCELYCGSFPISVEEA